MPLEVVQQWTTGVARVFPLPRVLPLLVDPQKRPNEQHAGPGGADEVGQDGAARKKRVVQRREGVGLGRQELVHVGGDFKGRIAHAHEFPMPRFC